MGPDFTSEWGGVRPQVLEVLATGRSAAASTSAGYIDGVLAETGQNAPAVSSVSPAAFLQTAPDGRSIETLYDEPIVWTKTAIKEGLSVDAALARTASTLTALTLTVLADTRRSVYGADIIQRPTLTGYVRMLNPPSCERCVLLAGKWFRWNEGFLRHPRCDCQHIPASEDLAGDLATDPVEYFNSLTPQRQDRLFGRSGARAIRDGADIYRVGNVRMRGLATPKAALRYGTPSRLTVDDIYRTAGTRTRAIRMLEEEGYILPRGQVAVRFAPGVRTDAQVIAAGRGRGTVTLDGRTVTTARASRFDAAATGVRDPLNRATMTSAERRLYDASYRLQYARRNGVIPRSVGLNSADVASGARGITATADWIDQLEADLARQIARITPGSSTHRVYLALNLGDEAAAAATFDRIAGATAPRATAGGTGGSEPPRRPQGFGRADDEPDEGDQDAFRRYWQQRQDAIGAGTPGELLQRHEIVFYEQLAASGHDFAFIPRPPRGVDGRRPSSNDFSSRTLAAEIEAKSFRKPRRGEVFDAIERSVVAARDNHGVIKDHFVVYSRQYPPSRAFLEQLRTYNQNRAAPIRRLFWWDGSALTEIDLL